MKRRIDKIVIGCVGIFFMFSFVLTEEGLAKDEILMGYSASVTGSYSHVGKMTKDGYTAWAEMVNGKGGIFVKDLNKKLKVRLTMYDDKSDPSTAAKLYEKLITDDKVDLVLSPWGSSIGFPVSGICQKYKMPIVYVWVSSDPIFKQGYDYAFCLIQPASQHEWSPLDLLKTSHLAEPPKKIIYISTKELYGITTAKGGLKRAQELGFETLYEEVEKACKDFTPLITKSKGLGVDAISTGLYEAEFFLMFKQMQELRFFPKFIFASHGTDLPDFWDTFGKVGEGACAGGYYHSNWRTFENEEFVAGYKKITGTFPTHYGATVAGAQIMKQAIEKAGTLSKEKVKNVLQEEEFQCLLYPKVKFVTEAGYTNLNKYAFTGVLQWQNGKLLTVYPQSLAETKFLYPMPWKK
jgi:branched-chain amino acid transport system substrate-binding protein